MFYWKFVENQIFFVKSKKNNLILDRCVDRIREDSSKKWVFLKVSRYYVHFFVLSLLNYEITAKSPRQKRFTKLRLDKWFGEMLSFNNKNIKKSLFSINKATILENSTSSINIFFFFCRKLISAAFVLNCWCGGGCDWYDNFTFFGFINSIWPKNLLAKALLCKCIFATNENVLTDRVIIKLYFLMTFMFHRGYSNSNKGINGCSPKIF